ncbi:hypothetical protein GCM10025875_17930 [Litorihabitans aurantiacus]|uniref:Uncharacterized protein n=1 Tax=Litorihabitans aurantiacus TaxID=1930061 RepID=A0AA37XEG3_9MICO|nr:hypothetical protein GCM10025875_17930 [Litorihabitans aurantiacus]
MQVVVLSKGTSRIPEGATPAAEPGVFGGYTVVVTHCKFTPRRRIFNARVRDAVSVAVRLAVKPRSATIRSYRRCCQEDGDSQTRKCKRREESPAQHGKALGWRHVDSL